jgi:hypothetical protein
MVPGNLGFISVSDLSKVTWLENQALIPKLGPFAQIQLILVFPF